MNGQNAAAFETTRDLASPDAGYWDELPIHTNLWTAAGTGTALGFIADTGGTAIRAATIGAASGVTAGGAGGAAGTLGTAFLSATLTIPQMKVGDIEPLQSLNAASSGGGPYAELLLLARCRGGNSTEDLDVFLDYFEGYYNTANWRLTNTQASPVMVVGTGADSFRWFNFPLLRSDIPTTTPPHTADRRNLLAAGLRPNNYPEVAAITIQNRTALAADEYIDIVGAVFRYKRHASNRYPQRPGLTNGGIVGKASGFTPALPSVPPSSAPAAW